MDTVKRKLRRPVPMAGIERQMFAATGLALLFGFTLSIACRDWGYFERSGALVILVAVIFAWRDHVAALGNIEQIYREHFAALLAKFDAARPPGIINGAIHDGKRRDLEARRQNVEELVNLLRQRIRTTEALILGIGTIIWGYGAPVAGFIWKFK